MEPGGPEVLSEVSIHALLVECDRGRQSALFRVCGFNPRTPCGVRRSFSGLKCAGISGFNPRTPCGVRRAGRSGTCGNTRFQSTHSLWSATANATRVLLAYGVSIHALLVECDTQWMLWLRDHPVSIHALLVECDRQRPLLRKRKTRFNPRTPCGVRQKP